MYQILHCADLHLDHAFTEDHFGPEVGAARRRELRATLTRIATLAREQQVDALTIAGDLYDHALIMPETIEFLQDQLARLAPIRVLIAPGQSDAYTNDSYYQRLHWPSHVYIFQQSTLQPVALAPDLYLWEASCSLSPGQKRIELPRLAVGTTNLMLTHLAAPVPQLKSPDDIFAVDSPMFSHNRFNCALLGHEHVGRIWPSGDAVCVYPGSPEILEVDQGKGLHGAVLISIDGQRCASRPIPLSRWHYVNLEMDITEYITEQVVIRQLEASLLEVVDQNDDRALCTIRLIGHSSLSLDLAQLARALNVQAHVRLDMSRATSRDYTALREERTVRGMILQRFHERLESSSDAGQRLIARAAQEYALQALSGERVCSE